MTRIALDAMGGDNAPGEIVLGGVEAAESLADVKVLLVGVQSQIEAELAKYPKLVEAAQKAGKGDKEVIADQLRLIRKEQARFVVQLDRRHIDRRLLRSAGD